MKKMTLVCLILVLGYFALSCTFAPSKHLTKELIWPAQGGAPDYLVIEWPKGISASNIETTDVPGISGELRAVSVAPLPPIVIAP